MNQNDEEIQRFLQRLYQLLKADSSGKTSSQERTHIPDRTVGESEQLTSSATRQNSDAVDDRESTDNSGYNESSSQDVTQIQNYLNQLGKVIGSEENSQFSTENQAEESSNPIPEVWQDLTETNITEEAPQASDDSSPQSQLREVIESVKASQEIDDVETAGILEELLEEFSLDPTNPKTIEYEELLEQLAIDETDPKTVKELNQLLSRLRGPVVQENSGKSLAEELEVDEGLEEPDDRVRQETRVEKPGKGSGSQTDTFSTLLSRLNLKSSVKGARTSKKNIRVFSILSFVMLSVILLTWFIYQYFRVTEIKKKVTKVLDSSPGIAFYDIQAEVKGKVLSLTGKLPHQHLRDRAGELAGSTVPDLVINNKIIVVDRPADMVQVSAEVEQIVSILNQIDGINISAKFEQGKVILEGTSIQHITIKNITQIFEEVPGVRQVENQIKIQPSSIPTRIYFNQNSAKILEGDLDSKINQIKELIQSYPHLKLKIIGYSHQTEASKESLELQRAQAVENFLEDRGIDRRRIQAVAGKGSPPDIASNQERWLSRSVVFEIIQSDLEHPEE